MPESAGPDSVAGSRPPSQFESNGDRFRFTVELRPGETTIVSWKKLLKEANIPNNSNGNANSNSRPNGPCPIEASQDQQQQPLPAQQEQLEGEAKDPAGSNRLSSVIERIERMYAGNGSSDEEDVVLDNVPDDDDYDTEDSFIDDTELDDYFQVDKSKLKHDGFFINHGKLEQIEPPTSTSQQPKKRRRKDVAKEDAGNDDVNNPKKHVKLGNKGRKASSLVERNMTNQFPGAPSPEPNTHSANVLNGASPTSAAEILLKKKNVEAKVVVDSAETSSHIHVRQDKDVEQQTHPLSKNSSNKLKESGEPKVTSTQKSIRKNSTLNKSHFGQKSNSADDLGQRIQQMEKVVRAERFDLNVPATAIRDSQEVSNVPSLPRKEGSSMKQRSSMLEKAIRELEKIVTESRPPSTEVQVPENTSQAVKRRLPPEIKQKLAKVARLSYAGFGKIPKDVLNRLMSIMGHLMQLRTLKRNIKIMASMGLSVKQEKDDQLRKIKHEVAEMVTQRIPYMKSKIEQQTTNSDDFQEADPQEKEALIRKYSIDDALENKICDLYDLYVERLEEDSGPPVRRLYEELTALWPSGFMDNNGIKRAIIRAKRRRPRALASQRKNPEKIKKMKTVTPKTQDTNQVLEATNTAQSSHTHEKVLSDSREQASNQMTKPVRSATICSPAANSPSTFQNLPNMDKPRQENKMKGNLCNTGSNDGYLKKKVKKVPNSDW